MSNMTESICEQINDLTRENPLTAVIGVKLEFCISLGYDEGEKVEPERLLRALRENLAVLLGDIGLEQAFEGLVPTGLVDYTFE